MEHKCQYCGAPLPEDAAFCHCCARSQITKKAMLPPEKHPRGFVRRPPRQSAQAFCW